MDVHVMDEGAGLEHQQIEETEKSDFTEASNAASASVQDEDGILEPYLGMKFASEDAAKTFYDEYAKRVGFTFKVSQSTHSKSHGAIIFRDFVCGREGAKRRPDDDCDAMIRIELKSHDKWTITRFVKGHNHPMVNPNKVHHLRPRRHFASAAKTISEAYQGSGVVPSGMMYVSMDGQRSLNDTNNRGVRYTPIEPKSLGVSNYSVRSGGRKRALGRDSQNLLEYFKKMQAENPGFFYAIQLDEENRMTNIFWADARSRIAYSHFGDAVTLDTMYRINLYRVPFTPITGVNHHGQSILFGCALMFDESEVSFVWLFKTFLTAMNDRQPVSIITDQDRAIETAVAQVFPEARHSINKWDVLREGQEKLAHVYLSYPNFQVELYNCINMTETIEEFEFSWNSIIEKYDLTGHEWLHSLYNARAQWAPVYFRNSFFAKISPSQGLGGSFFDGYVNQQTTLPMFFRQYERAMDNWFEREIEADFDTICTTPVLKTQSPMEKQAANLYTRKIFGKFQEELVETFVYTANRIEGDSVTSTFRVAKFEDESKAYIVTFNYPEMRANCSCQMFEYSGILCRHILTVFTVTNVLTLPSHFILKRWTRNAKVGEVLLDDHGAEISGQDTLTLRYNSLCREAIRYAEEGAVAIDTYNVALGILREGSKKIAAVKKNLTRVAPPSSQGSAAGYDERKSSTSDATSFLWPRQDEMVRRFNLNDLGAAPQLGSDMNLPHMAPVSLNRDDGGPESMVVLPCLKSMTWIMETKNSMPGNKVAVINLKLQDYSKVPSAEMEVKFQLSKLTLEPMLRSMAYISEQLSTPANRVAVINLKLQDTETISGESEVKFQVSRDTLGAMLRSMAYIREQLSNAAGIQSDPQPQLKKQRK